MIENINQVRYNEEHRLILLSSDFNKWRQKNRDIVLLLEGAELKGLKLSEENITKGISLFPAIMTNANLEGAHLECCHLFEIDFSNANLSNAKLSNCVLDKANFSNSKIEGGTINFCSLNDTIFKNAQLDNCKIMNVDYSGLFHLPTKKYTNFQNASCKNSIFQLNDLNVDFSNTDLENSQFIDTKLLSSDFTNANLGKSSFNNSSFTKCNFSFSKLFDIEIDDRTIFPSSIFKKAKIDRFSLECITQDKIQISSRVQMEIFDDIAKLRQYFSGYLRLIHLIFLILFLVPYVLFIIKLLIKARFLPDDPCMTITMIGAIGRYIVSGGKSWEFIWQFELIPIICFSIAFIYNCIRFALITKTIKLENEQEIRGLPVRFSLGESNWGKFFTFQKWLFWLNIIVVAWNTIHFLLQRVNTGLG